MIDGEGTIVLATTQTRATIYPRVAVTNTNLENIGRTRVLFRALTARDVLPGVKRDDRQRPCFFVAVSARRDIEVVLKAVRPWLVGKRPQADVMLEYLETTAPLIGTRSSGHDTRERLRIRQKQREFVEKMRALNRRYRKGEWARLHPEETDPATIDSNWRPGERAEFLGDSWDSIKALLQLRCDEYAPRELI